MRGITSRASITTTPGSPPGGLAPFRNHCRRDAACGHSDQRHAASRRIEKPRGRGRGGVHAGPRMGESSMHDFAGRDPKARFAEVPRMVVTQGEQVEPHILEAVQHNGVGSRLRRPRRDGGLAWRGGAAIRGNVACHETHDERREGATLVCGSPGIPPDQRTVWQTRKKARSRTVRRAAQKQLTREPGKRLRFRKPRPNPRSRSHPAGSPRRYRN